MSHLTDMPRAPGSAQASRIEPSALRLLDLERREQRLLKASEKALVKAARLIARVEKDRLRAVLALRYLDGQGWPEIAATLNLSQKTTWNLHGEAMQVLENVQKYET
jgi:DNA-directed RNA polymerase specialized sigma subunit